MKKIKKFKKLFILMLVATMLLAVGCTSKNDSNTTKNDASNNEDQNSEATNAAEGLALDYSTGLDENGFYSDVKAADYVELVDYDNISIPSKSYVIPEEAIQTKIGELLESYSTTSEVVDRAVENGDTVNIDYIGSVDGVEFEGGSTAGNGTEVTIGKTSYIDDFLEQLIGHSPGESFDIEVTFPEEYGVEDLNGKDAVFAVTINYISKSVKPQLSDAFVSENLSTSFDSNTIAELRSNIKSDLQDNAVKGFIQNYLVVNMIVSSVPEEVLAYQQTIMTNYYTMSASSNNMTLEEFLAGYVGYDTLEALIEASSDKLIATSQFALIIQAIAEDANISVTDEALTTYFVKETGSEDYSQFEDIYGISYLKNSILKELVLDYLVEHAELEK